MPEIVKTHGGRKAGALKDRFEAAGGQGLGVLDRPDPVGENEPMIHPEPGEPHPLL
jgi:hypothetical protein